ncbi:transcriptional activator of glycolytic enzymes-domain-containing protein [Gamsiella multidivaricata]|uniref:transcriptional activator of glycolytic enzymes-domain-containing protein n=1 Tax=Gamsiella multidivaricata TaxID=101098 RepID=UPI00221F891D|nr:transcriptional activator of glycolytic enzymes-domain-containing protein [Gamsiella multidivaricata]KAI7821220.1 transcriptional activator of glycolytic enzymes-domain-containing protein [Gamsiella multidivaricata]
MRVNQGATIAHTRQAEKISPVLHDHTHIYNHTNAYDHSKQDKDKEDGELLRRKVHVKEHHRSQDADVVRLGITIEDKACDTITDIQMEPASGRDVDTAPSVTAQQPDLGFCNTKSKEDFPQQQQPSNNGSTAPISSPSCAQPLGASDHRNNGHTNEEGLDLWHKWIAQQQNKANSTNPQITPRLLLEYLNAVILPMELSSEPKPMVQTYVKPILQLWEQQQPQVKETSPGNIERDQLQTSSLPPALLATHDFNGTTATQRQQDHLERLIQLERSHRDTTLVISQLQEQVRYLLRDKERGLRSWDHDETYLQRRRLQRPLSPSPPGEVIHPPRSHVLLHRPHLGARSHSEIIQYEPYSHHSPQHVDFQQGESLGVISLEPPIRNRKRSSSMGGPGALIRENIKQARSCSPPRPRTNSGATAREGSLALTASHDSSNNVPGGEGHIHAQSQPPQSASVPPSASLTYSKSFSGAVSDTSAPLKDGSSISIQYGTVDMHKSQTAHYRQHSRSIRGHKYSHTSQLSRSVPYLDDEYLMFHQQQQGHIFQHPEDESSAAAFDSHGIEHHYSPYFQSNTNHGYRGRHCRNQDSVSSQYSSSQHQYQRNDSRVYHEYDLHTHPQQQQPQLSNYRDQKDEDVKPITQQHQQDNYHAMHSKKHQQQEGPPPIYVMNRQVNTVPELWKEWTVGLGSGNPSIRQLEAQFGPSWRTSSSAANFFSRRLRIINEIQRMIDFEGLSEDEAVNKLEARREQGVVVPGTEGVIGPDGQPAQQTTGGMSLHRLSEILRKKQL